VGASKRRQKFGRTVRRLRQQQGMSLREFAEEVGISPSYLAPIERDVFSPPAEPKIRAIAQALEQDTDELLALAGRVAADVTDGIRRRPRQMAALIRAAAALEPEQVERLASSARRMKTRRLASQG